MCYKLPTGVDGPLPSGTVGLTLGRSGFASQGFIVRPCRWGWQGRNKTYDISEEGDAS